MLNNVVLMGRLTDTPELRKTTNDTSTTRFTIAVDRDFKDRDGNRATDFIDCVAWRQSADFVTSWFKKGQMIAVTGSIQVRNYDDKQGNKRKAVEVIADHISFCGDKARDNAGSGSYSGNAAPAPRQNAPASAPQASFSAGSESDFEEVASDDDLPF